VNSLLNETDVVHGENFIFPKSLHICMIRYEGESSVAHEELEQLHEGPDENMIHGCVTGEREACASP
jgi:hypothetical protein